ncbi:MAG: hypothetical protein WCB61_08590 [Pseudolabrys sp.]|jgi:hypothetical protein
MLDFIITTSSVLVHNEWAKLAATFCNSSAVAAFVGGVIAPMFSDKFNTLWKKGGIWLLGMIVAVLFHFIGRAFLSTLR